MSDLHNFDDRNVAWMSTYEILSLILELTFIPTKYPNIVLRSTNGTCVSYVDLRHLVRHLKTRLSYEELQSIRERVRDIAQEYTDHE